ncbi:TetR/AcrR family transcriptional regulator [Plantibacter sp. VKM Ac-2880]|uniref:TetR/AcrR family transcriptional regulator n=1 Tax=Plantibacter sp. VKM Ac-2880 TaxID=2783827 RepID=UPI00188F7917|nr:TetR/AcrR family transcriptional regulator [Plantibacter sp. VKM Ac-2880]MBF4570651.1 TetR/AcrR family transcriptional regulator [Plantibacter sp. VKM Ac-2880]
MDTRRGRPTAAERDRRREAILDVAIARFTAYGYGGTTIEAIAADAGVTKRTIYSWFGDLAGVLSAAVERQHAYLLAVDAPGSDAESLEDAATRLVLALHSDVSVALHRLVIAESPRFPEVAARFYAAGPARSIAFLGAQLGPASPAGQPGPRAEQLYTLLLGEPHRRRLLGLTPAPTPEAARAHARACLALVDGA